MYDVNLYSKLFICDMKSFFGPVREEKIQDMLKDIEQRYILDLKYRECQNCIKVLLSNTF